MKECQKIRLREFWIFSAVCDDLGLCCMVRFLSIDIEQCMNLYAAVQL